MGRNLEVQAADRALGGREGLVVLHEPDGDARLLQNVGPEGLGEPAAGIPWRFGTMRFTAGIAVSMTFKWYLQLSRCSSEA